ncbi:protein-disulfide reductase DsbD N-terminal domain-containing protein [Solimonas sp. SE-A11]|uniref:protein-disulfide reductase DsbD N-terminal domain-containing protein n=1 Tax=Solimonas sp. SE-A11 TaxID=3054954 RepID=UPI00259C735C|nr:protein-disulfide reductase DsbD N-terminal domain-containing protein [Solimonas sp. SE-A11]MDM4769767.1 protein-disulfide reductase DsbD N-terminal domain-containing protein [Solimonas sp. SE-A11]
MPLIRTLLLALACSLAMGATARPTNEDPAAGRQPSLARIAGEGGGARGAGGGLRANPGWLSPAEESLLPVEEAFQLLPARRQAQALKLEWNIAPGYYLYRGQLAFEVLTPQGFRLAPPRLPKGETIQDREFGKVEVYRGIVAAEFDLPPGMKGPLKLRVHYQGCADLGICYPPQQQQLAVPAAVRS